MTGVYVAISCPLHSLQAVFLFAGIAGFALISVPMQGPLMLEMNVLPDVAAATSATMILFTSLVGSLVFISFGAIE